jgi:hypothetical protein
MYEDYTVVSRMGDDVSRLYRPVRSAMKEGWVPLGGIHIAGPLDNGVMLFTQAMGLPKGNRVSQTSEF